MFLNFINSPLSLFLDSLIAVPLTTTYIAIFIPNLSCDFWTLMFSHLQEILCYTSTRCQILLNLLVQRQLAVSCCCCCSVTQSCLTLCDPLDCSMPGFPVLHDLLEFAQTHVNWVDDAIQPSNPPSPPYTVKTHLKVFKKMIGWWSHCFLYAIWHIKHNLYLAGSAVALITCFFHLTKYWLHV